MMDSVIFQKENVPDCQNAVLIEGLPGIGRVGQIAADYLVEKLNSEKFITIYSPFFPPQVMVDDEGLVHPMIQEMHHCITKSGRHLLFLTGDYQGLTGEAQYALSHEVLKLASSMDVKEIITLGGYGVRKILEEPRVLGAATSNEIVSKMEEFQVVFKSEHPTGGIVGASGILLGLAPLFDLEGVCLMGETHGAYPDHIAAKMILKVLDAYLDLDLVYDDLDEPSPALEALKAQIKEMDQEAEKGYKEEQELNYFV